MEVIQPCISDLEMAGFLWSDTGIVEKQLKIGKWCLWDVAERLINTRDFDEQKVRLNSSSSIHTFFSFCLNLLSKTDLIAKGFFYLVSSISKFKLFDEPEELVTVPLLIEFMCLLTLILQNTTDIQLRTCDWIPLELL